MLSIWGKKPTPAEGGKASYYSANGGQVLSADGTGYVLPDMGAIEADKADYIPKDFAAQKVQAIVKDSQQAKETFKEHVGMLKSYYEGALEESKTHYEDIIKDLKKKAQRHVEVNKILRQQTEERLSKELKQSEDSLEELRDDMARLNREYQDEVRTLKGRLHDIEDRARRQQEFIDVHETTAHSRLALNDLISEIELRDMRTQHLENTRELLNQIQSIQQDHGYALADEQEAHGRALQHIKDSMRTRSECREALDAALLQVEVREMRASLASVSAMRAEIGSLEERSAVAEEQVARLTGELQEARERHEALTTQGAAYMEELERMSAQYEEERQQLQSAHEAQLAAHRSSADGALGQARDSASRAEVRAVLDSMVLALVQASLRDAQAHSEAHSHQLSQSNAHLDDLHAQHHSQLQSAERTLQAQLQELHDRYGWQIKTLESQSTRLQVEGALEYVVAQVAEAASASRAKAAEQALESFHFHQSSSKDQLVEEINDLRSQLEQARADVIMRQEEVQRLHDDLQHHASAAPTGGDRALPPTKPQSEQPMASVAVAAVAAPVVVDEALERAVEEARMAVSALTSRLSDALNRLPALQQEREKTKVEIKEWTRDFVAANGREPEVSEKAQIKDKYQRYKVSSGQAKELEGVVAQLSADKPALEAKLAELEAKLVAASTPVSAFAPAHAAVSVAPIVSTTATQSSSTTVNPGPGTVVQVSLGVRPVVECKDKEVQVAPHELRALQGLGGSQADLSKLVQQGGANSAAMVEALRAQHEAELEKLEDQLFDLKSRAEALDAEKQTLKADHDFIAAKLEEMIKEKRTDVLKRYEEDLKKLRASEKDLNEKVTALSGEKARLDMRVKEVTSRAELAEQELKERDAREIAALPTADEKVQLKTTITKQRDQIVLKSKAATAGWDAAAKADEKIELEVQRAYNKGMKDEREQHKKDMDGVHSALEAKEQRITQLLVEITEMEKTVRASTADQAAMKKQMEAMKLEVADAIAAIQTMGGGGGGGSGEGGEDDGPAPSQAELEGAREQLDLAQEELVQLGERCDRLEGELEMARKKNRYFERLAQLTGLDTGKVAMPTGAAQGASKQADSSVYDLAGVLNNVKKVVVKCTNLWKSNRKDECFDAYLDCCVDAAAKLLTDDLVKPLRDSTEHGRGQGAMNKQRGAVVLRKALDKLLADAALPGLRAAEEAAVASLRQQESSTAQIENENKETMVQDVVQQLRDLENHVLDLGYTKERNPTNSSSAGDEMRSPRGDHQTATSLLQRAKAAEGQVDSLRRQLAAVVAATALGGDGDGGNGVGRGGAEAGASSVVAGEAVAGGEAKAVVAAAAGRGGGGADPAEVRRLNRKIKELEAQLKSGGGSGGGGQAGSGGGGGGGGGAEVKALQQAEKVLTKKLKDQEAAAKRDAKGLELRATKAENALQKIQSTYAGIVAERDQLKAENAKLFNISGEVQTLRAKAQRCDELDGAVAVKEQELAMLQEQFKKESALRKKYKNELEDLKGAIRVYARCRPMARYELEKGCKAVVEIKDETSLRLTTSRGEKDFEFDAVFSATSTQDQVFEDTKRLVESCLDGFNVCLFAYGQTGSGKTHTMTGSADNPGLTPKAIDELFRLMGERAHLQIKVSTYFVELYNDNLVDLFWLLDNKAALAKNANLESPKLDIKMDAKKMVYIRNSVIKEVASPEELMDLFMRGNVERHTGATKMNAESSRSHSIFAIMVEAYDTTSRRTTNGKLSLVDLAGSERADKTGASAERLKEAQNINKSLSALGDVIAALSEGGANKHIPYRNNKLTQVMQDSLGGNAKTLMFVNFSPADYNADETSTSLMYASRVKKIVNNASKQAESEEVARLKAIIKRLQGGQTVADLEPEPEPEPEPGQDDGKVYDGY